MANKESFFTLSRKSKVIGFTMLAATMSAYQYKNMRCNNQTAVQDGIWKPFMNKIYPLLKKSIVS